MIETGKELALAAKNVAEHYKTLYIRGCFGWPMNECNKGRAIASYAYNRTQSRSEMIRSASDDTFGFDCVCLIKALLWGWSGDASKGYGGATYCSNNVPDKNADQMFNLCSDVSGDFSDIEVGEAVWMKGHIGVYIGNGLAVECTPAWKNGVQITAVGNIGKKDGYQSRKWSKHGKLPYVHYEGGFRVELHLVRQGMKGEDVRALQGLLIAQGCGCGKSGADGLFGENTKKALLAFQEKHGLEVDGIAGQESFTALLGVGR